jgi:hypothetical protein
MDIILALYKIGGLIMIMLIKNKLSKYALKFMLIAFVIYTFYLTLINTLTFNQFIYIGIFSLLGLISIQLTNLNKNFKEK